MADLGKIGITYDSAGYVGGKTYEPLTVLKYTDGGTYMSIAPTLGHLPTDTNYWVCMVPPTEASSIDYTPLAGGVITNATVQGAIEQADSLKQNKSSMVGTNVNNANTYPNSALLYSINQTINDSLTRLSSNYTLLNTTTVSTSGTTNITFSETVSNFKFLYTETVMSNIIEQTIMPISLLSQVAYKIGDLRNAPNPTAFHGICFIKSINGTSAQIEFITSTYSITVRVYGVR